MSDSASPPSSPWLAGFDFLRPATGAGAPSTTAGFGHWIAPTVSVEELEKRIAELKTVQFWLEQNLLGLKATVQALEVQKMTLAALRGMNLGVADVARAFTLPAGKGSKAPTSGAAAWPFADAAQAPSRGADRAAPAGEPAASGAESAKSGPGARREKGTRKASPEQAPGLADPMLWWGALTEQFQQIAGQALQQAARAQGSIADPAQPAARAATNQARTDGKPAAQRRRPVGKKTTLRKGRLPPA